MGLLSTLLTVGGTIAGSFVGMPQVGAAIGGAIGGAVDQSHASSKATDAQVAAQAAAQAARERAAGQVTQIQAPYLNAGYSSVNALTGRLGLGGSPAAPGPPATANSNTSDPNYSTYADAFHPLPAGSPTGPAMASAPGGQPAPPSYSTYLAANPDLAAEAQKVTADGQFPSTQAYLQWHDQNYPTENRPSTADPSAAPQTNALTGAPATSAPASGVDPGTFGSTANPTAPAPYVAPKPFTFDLSNYTPSPAYQWQQDQARNSILASNSATGALRSGAALKELQDRAQNIAYGDFSNERTFAAGQNNTNNQNALTAYNTNQNAYIDSRDYLTGRSDTQTNNLFRLAGAGQTAGLIDSNAALGVGTGAAGAAVATGNAQATNALTQGTVGSNLATGLGGVISSNANALTGLFKPPNPGVVFDPSAVASGFGAAGNALPANAFAF